ncbi:Wilms tumor protein 1-interacting protein [Limanda limanda]|uniref:Wilms tumor protein 1-interacting protein n=1 Tax=Limanda limanda TaxID=27771 RepID=UPI0029C917C7|nr:Wilms tumor protein 1-interacting protein [Limanda limanda]
MTDIWAGLLFSRTAASSRTGQLRQILQEMDPSYRTSLYFGKKLSGQPFYTVSGGIYCENDFLYSGVHPAPEVCNSCGFLIMDNMVLQARGRSYHPSCFRCVVCSQSLEGQPFSVDADRRVYCVSDYHRLRAPCCAACRTPILPTEGSTESVRVVSLDRSYHVECFSGDVNLI